MVKLQGLHFLAEAVWEADSAAVPVEARGEQLAEAVGLWGCFSEEQSEEVLDICSVATVMAEEAA